MPVRVHPRVSAKRPEITDDDAQAAFAGTLRRIPRFDTEPVQWIGVGLDTRGRLVEWVAIENKADEWLIFHAMPATTKTLIEVGLRER